MKKKLLSALLVSGITLSATALPLAVNADSIDDQIASQDKKIKDLSDQENTETAKLADIQANISSIRSEAEGLQTEQANLGKQIGQLNKDISSLEKRIEKRNEAIKEQARSVQVDSANSNMVDLVLSSDSVSDAITKVFAASKLVGANKDLMQQQQDDKDAVEAKRNATEEKNAEIQKNAVALEAKKGELEDQQLAQTAAISQISADKEKESSKKNEFLAQKAEAEKQREEQRKAVEAAKQAAEQQKEEAAKQAAEQQKEEAAKQAVTESTKPATSNTENTTVTTGTSSTIVSPSKETGSTVGATNNTVNTTETTTVNTTNNNTETTTTPTVSKPETTPTTAPSNGNAVVAEAYKHIGKPYVWGAKGPGSFDCSGFTSYVYRQAAGREIGGWTVPQESAGQTISLSELQPGDLVFWGGHGSTHHVGIYVGGGQYIHAPQPGESVTVQSISAWSPDFGVRM
ncbi:C40 family peptidase [Vagococcus vulneris]|uniref:NlpC/P60 domain-containing protein n=1 Tax=Vagococcus vulneris TaxID=1977869 RepID=A0A429ZY54_9ENTE|nr:C40 family peptidase [Vagococcus vulneris]RST98882.1 hypothetical protein CBF37_05785 [Vagococcus vulneris]